MEPGFIALIGTLAGGFFLKGVENMLKKKKPEAEELVAKDVLAELEKPIKNDWFNKAFVADVHRRIRDEAIEYGKAITVCKCFDCNMASINRELDRLENQARRRREEAEKHRREEKRKLQERVAREKKRKFDEWTRNHSKWKYPSDHEWSATWFYPPPPKGKR